MFTGEEPEPLGVLTLALPPSMKAVTRQRFRHTIVTSVGVNRCFSLLADKDNSVHPKAHHDNDLKRFTIFRSTGYPREIANLAANGTRTGGANGSGPNAANLSRTVMAMGTPFRHSGSASEPESSLFKDFWTPSFDRVTA